MTWPRSIRFRVADRPPRAGPPEGWERRQPRTAVPWYCRLGWHPPWRITPTSQHGVTTMAICIRCGTEGMLDSQGNLF